MRETKRAATEKKSSKTNGNSKYVLTNVRSSFWYLQKKKEK